MAIDLQAPFDKAVAGVLGQGWIAFNPATNTCNYFKKSGTGVESKCAVGHLLPDEVVRTTPMNFGVSSIAYYQPTLWENLKAEYGIIDPEDENDFVTFLAEIQTQHDRAVAHVMGQSPDITEDMVEPFKKYFRSYMQTIAKDNNLEWHHE